MFYKQEELVGPSRVRTFCFRHFNSAVTVIWIVAIITIVAWGVKARLTPDIHQTTTSRDAHSSLLIQSSRRENAPVPTNIQVETFTLGFFGFEPKQINRKPGPFVLGIDIPRRLQSASFVLVSEDGHKPLGISWPRGQIRIRKLLHLPPGNYLLKEANNPHWTAHITIEKD